MIVKEEMAKLRKEIPSKRKLLKAERQLEALRRLETRINRRDAALRAEIRRANQSVNDLRANLEQVKGKRECPICFQKITDPSRVTKHYLGEIHKLGSQKVALIRELEEVTAKLEALKRGLQGASANLESLKRKAAKEGELSRERHRLATLREDLRSSRDKANELKTKIEQLTGEQASLGFDPTKFRRLDAQLTALRRTKVVENFTGAETQLARLPDVRQAVTEWQTRKTEFQGVRTDLMARLKKLGRIVSRYTRAKEQLEQAQGLLGQNSNRLAAERQNRINAANQVTELKAKQRTLRQNLRTIKEFADERAALEELRGIFRGIPEVILRRLRPFIEKEGTDILHEFSGGEISALNIEEQTLNVAATMNGEIRPIHYFSGGQKTRINMALRVAISRILSRLPQTEEHALATMQTLFIDEGDFGNLDEAGIQEAVSVVRRLTKEFDRVILISHVDGIREIFQGYTIEVVKTGPSESTVKTSAPSSTAAEMPEITA
jgi:exonuclease SbcC